MDQPQPADNGVTHQFLFHKPSTNPLDPDQSRLAAQQAPADALSGSIFHTRVSDLRDIRPPIGAGYPRRFTLDVSSAIRYRSIHRHLLFMAIT